MKRRNKNIARYIFNAQKITNQEAKEKMQTVFQGSRANDIFAQIYPKMAQSLNLDIQNPVLARQQYNQMISNWSNPIFNFVITN